MANVQVDQRKHQMVIGVSFLLLALIFLLFFNSSQNLKGSAKKAKDTAITISEMEVLISALKKAETSHRNYLVTADRGYVTKAIAGYSEAQRLLLTIAKKTRLDAVLKHKTDSLQSIITYRIQKQGLIFSSKSWIFNTSNRERLRESLDTLVDTRRIVRDMQLRKYDLLTQGIITATKYSHYTTVLSVLAALVIIVSTILLYKDLEKSFNYRVDLERENRMMEKKDEFLTIASHELKTPLTSLKGYMQILRRVADRKGDTEIEPLITRVNRQVEKLTALVRDLVTVSKISLGQLDYDFTEFNFQEVLEDVEIYARQLSDHHKIEIKGEPDILIKADRNKIEQVLGNLVSNAIKYSNGNNTIIIEVQPKGGFLSVRVTDFGIGIPEEKRHLIFDRFYRVKSTDYTASGLGIGLYISLEITKRHQGTLTVNSEPGKWTAFNLTIPIVN